MAVRYVLTRKVDENTLEDEFSFDAKSIPNPAVSTPHFPTLNSFRQIVSQKKILDQLSIHSDRQRMNQKLPPPLPSKKTKKRMGAGTGILLSFGLMAVWICVVTVAEQIKKDPSREKTGTVNVRARDTNPAPVPSKSSGSSSRAPVINSAWDGSVSQVKRYFNQNAKDPKSVEYIEWSQVAKQGSGYLVGVKYRAKNSFGGYVIEEAIFVLDENGVVVTMVPKGQ